MLIAQDNVRKRLDPSRHCRRALGSSRWDIVLRDEHGARRCWKDVSPVWSTVVVRLMTKRTACP